MRITTLASIIGFVIAVICIADARRWNRQEQTLYRFFLLNGHLRLKGFVASITAANLSLGNFLIFIATWGYTLGTPGLLWFSLNLVLNVLGFRWYFPHFKKYIEDHANNGTIHDFLAVTYAHEDTNRDRRFIRFEASIVTVLGLLFAIVFELSLAVVLFGRGGLLENFATFSILVLLICILTGFGGFRSLVTSDICQSILLTAATLGLVVLVISRGGASLAPYIWKFNPHSLNIGWPNILSITVIGSGWMLVAMDQWQRTCASRSYDTSIKGVFTYLPIVWLFAVAYALWGLYDRVVLLPSLSPAMQILHSGGSNPLLDILLVPAGPAASILIKFIACGLIAAAVSTTNTFLTVCSHSITSDVLVAALANRSISTLNREENAGMVSIARGVIIGMGVLVVTAFLSLTHAGLLNDPLSFFFIAYSVQFALLAPMIMSRLPRERRPSSKAAIVSIFVALIASLGGGFSSWYKMGHGGSSFLWVMPADWLTLTPVVTLIVGLLPLLISMLFGKEKGARINAH